MQKVLYFSLDVTMRVFIFSICSLVLLAPALPFKSYAGYQVFRTLPLDESSMAKLAPLYFSPEFDFWSSPRVGYPVDIMAAPEHVERLRSALTRQGLRPSVLVADVGATIEKERAKIKSTQHNDKLLGRAPNLDRYLNLSEIQAYLDEVAAAFPSIATIIDIGTSYEGRPLRVLKLSNGPGKNGIWFDAAVHAREWAGPPTILHAINELTENLAVNQAMLDKNDFYFLPVANPDGYAFSWENDRLWRKTRSATPESDCIGADPNRNFDYAWGGGSGVNYPCGDNYPGSAPFSEPETKAMADFLTANPSITFYVSVHSYGQYLLIPWGDRSAFPPTEPELRGVAQLAMDALKAVNGTHYYIGSTYNMLYSAYGLSEDWAYGVLGIPLSYTIELPGGGESGFVPPASAIGPVTTETWEAYKVFAANIPASRFQRRMPRN